MRILVTNDDGIQAPGIRVLARALASAGHDVVVAAPSQEASGMSAAMTAVEEDGRIVVVTHTIDGLDGVEAYGVAGSPAFIVLIASRGAFGPAPDLVYSGINRGANAGLAVLHSGTVGAAFTAADNGSRALAVSLDVLTASAASAASGGAAGLRPGHTDAGRHWETAAAIAADLLPTVKDLPEGTVLNLNVPDLPRDHVKGVRRARLARFGQVQMAVAETGRGYVRTALEESSARLEEGTDLALLAEGYATLTAVRAVSEVDVDLPDGP
ncbi:5'/3'-nucleotidase SurE [Phytohabitans sp. ZYX-F-186]|uniref:5'-nucleotidase n=1 Tax=Phytohabitans maris TaxID=3071409 RepID=A0ABU0Z7V2_9ACTN|nr:5'/3'-nucleotidase SurE [Phytohabitans sp. ZYX-F-186]MDQ7903136.1 5'/3'-nucleotidase SurE [Phytohabitans sp. ZYX-F-186]